MGLPLDLSNLEVRGDDRRPILHIDALEVPAGSRIGVRGPSGAGKSTLLMALAGLVPAATGAIRWGDTDLSQLSESERARFRREHVGLIFQDFLLFEELTAGDNAALAAAYATSGERRAIRNGAAALLDHLGLGGHGERSVANFSGGERQRVAVARALANDPPILLADEPTASLDRDSADRLIADLAALAAEKGTTLIVVSHDPAVHTVMDRTLEIVDGTLVVTE